MTNCFISQVFIAMCKKRGKRNNNSSYYLGSTSEGPGPLLSPPVFYRCPNKLRGEKKCPLMIYRVCRSGAVWLSQFSLCPHRLKSGVSWAACLPSVCESSCRQNSVAQGCSTEVRVSLLAAGWELPEAAFRA